MVANMSRQDEHEANAELIAACRELIPELFAEIDALQRPLKEVLGPTITVIEKMRIIEGVNCECVLCGLASELARLRTLCGEKGK